MKLYSTQQNIDALHNVSPRWGGFQQKIAAAFFHADCINRETLVTAFPFLQQAFPRKCEITGQGMDKGYLYDGHICIKYEKDLISYIRKQGGYQRVSDDYVLSESYESGMYMYTDWEEFEEGGEVFKPFNKQTREEDINISI